MQNIQKNPMVTVAEAATALGIDGRTVREKLSTEEWKGEKRMIGMKEKWFMFRGELDRQLERLRVARPQERVSTQGLENVFESEDLSDAQTVDAQAVELQSNKQTAENISVAIDDILTKLTEQFSKQLHAEKEVIFSLKKELEEKDRQLRLLPDLQKRAEDERKAAELRALEAEALRKQIAALQTQKEEQERAAEVAKQDAEEAKEKELAERLAAEEKAQAKSLELEKELAEKRAREEAIEQQLASLQEQLQKLQQPKPSWWKKWFLSPPPQQ